MITWKILHARIKYILSKAQNINACWEERMNRASKVVRNKGNDF